VKSVLVFCGSSPGLRPEYTEVAAQFGRLLAERELETVYGGASVGVMGALADGALAAGGKVIGIIPRRLLDSEIAHAGLTKLHIVESMHERKALMGELSDAVAVLPGGSGTLDELFEFFTWNQLDLHYKPIGLLEVGHYWQLLLQFLDHAVVERFLRAEHLETLLVERDGATLLDRLAEHQPRVLGKWLDRRDAGQAG
jgi:uncharacterized protein (TIGR00730 family)